MASSTGRGPVMPSRWLLRTEPPLMRRFLGSLLASLAVVALTADTLTDGFESLVSSPCDADGFRVTPTRDPMPPTGIYIPTDLDDAFAELQRLLPACFIEQLRATGDVWQNHLRLGLLLRNHWGLWQRSRLAQYFESSGIHHPDDMSLRILVALRARLAREPISPPADGPPQSTRRPDPHPVPKMTRNRPAGR